MNNIKKIIASHFPIVRDTPATPPNPRIAAIKAITRNAIAHPSN